MADYAQLYLIVINLSCLIFVGFLLRRFKAVDENTMTGLDKLIFNVLFPVKTTMSFYNMEFGNDLSLKYFVCLNVTLLFYIFLTFYFSKTTNEDKSVVVLEANGMSRGNFIIISFPILNALFGDKGIVIAGVITGISQLFYNFYTVNIYGSLVEENNSNKTLLINVFRTPLMIGLFVGVLLYVTKINILSLETSLKSLRDTTGISALVTMGYGLSFRINFREIKLILRASAVKLSVLPLTGLLIGETSGLSGIQKVVALTLLDVPTAVNTHVFAKGYCQDGSLAGYYAVSATILYLFTLLFLIKLI